MNLSIKEVVAMLDHGDVSPEELIVNLCQRIEEFDKSLNSCKALNDRVLEDAKSLNLLHADRNKLHGLPVSVKDLIDTAGLKTTYGSPIFGNHIPEKDASVVVNIKESGGTILCKTNTHEFALGMETPPTRNPWDLSRIPGGSSGGSAAALSADLALFALGTDTGGSIRIPASMCGVVGLKPTYGSLPMEGIFEEASSLDHLGPMCRFASDLPLLLEVMGYPRKIHRVEKKLSVGVEVNFLEQADKQVKSVVEKLVDKCVSEGFIEVKEFQLPSVERINSNHSVIDTSEIANVHQELFKSFKNDYLSTSVEQIELGSKNKVVDYEKALRYRDLAIEEMKQAFNGIDLLVTPTLPKVAPMIADVRRMTLFDHEPYVKFLQPFNYTGFPAITIPSGFCNDLPVGTQFITPPWKENIMIGLASRYQSVTKWHTQVPGKYGRLAI